MLRQRKKDKKKEKRNEYWLLAFGMLLGFTDDILQSFTRGLASGSLTPNQWGASVLATLHFAHSQAYVQGAGSAGVSVTPMDVKPYIDFVTDEQATFLEGFVEDLESKDKRYLKTIDELYPEGVQDVDPSATVEEGVSKTEIDELTPPGELVDDDLYYDEKAINQRLSLYVERLRGTANWGAVDMLDAADEIRWVLDTNENHCETCLSRSKVMWLKGTLPGVPGDGSSECGVHDRCHLELSDGTIIQF